MTKTLNLTPRWTRLAGAAVLAMTLAACGGGGSGGDTPPPGAPPGTGQQALTVSKSGAGLIRSQPVGIDCGTTCQASYESNVTVTLTATPDAGQSFSGWGGSAPVLLPRARWCCRKPGRCPQPLHRSSR